MSEDSKNPQIVKDKELREAIQKILSGEKDFPIPLSEVSNHDFRAFEAGYHAYERHLKKYLQTILEG